MSESIYDLAGSPEADSQPPGPGASAEAPLSAGRGPLFLLTVSGFGHAVAVSEDHHVSLHCKVERAIDVGKALSYNNLLAWTW